MHTVHRRPHQAGFTLIELSIVLVIIGLIVGGVLSGQDMIRSAEIRSTMTQVERLNTAANTFRDKYNGLPGDLGSTKALQFGFLAREGVAGKGDGNRFIEGCATGATAFICEVGAFWSDLSSAGMVSGNYSSFGAFGAAADGLTAAITGGQMTDYMPEAELGQGNYLTIFSAGGRNYVQIAQITGISDAGVYTLGYGLTPQTAFNIDDKMDDGNPFRGNVLAASSATAPGTFVNTGVLQLAAIASPVTPPMCAGGRGAVVSATNPAIYNTIDSTTASSMVCQLAIRTSF
jgi:prepilin-type N-terminal cleavage/methylation domain-containing protein